MIHIVFNEADVTLMKKLLDIDESLAGDIIQIKDDFAVGPILSLDTEEGWNKRVDWWRDLLQGSPYAKDLAGSFDDRETVKQLQTRMEENGEEEIWLWMGQNQHDVSGYYWLIPQLREYKGRISIIYMNNLPCINEKGQLFYPSWLHEILPTELKKAKILVRQITSSEFEIDPDEWTRLSEENAMVRILEGGKKLAGKSEDYFDTEILKNITGEWQKSWRVLSNTLNRMKIKTGDVFIMWRMKQLITEGKIDVNGDPAKNWKEFDVKNGSGKKESVAVANEAGTE